SSLLAAELADERQSYSATRFIPGASEAAQWSEDILKLRVWDAWPMVADVNLRRARGAADAHFDRRRSVASRVLQQVPHHPAQQARVSTDRDRLALELGLLIARTLLARERQQIYLFVRFPPLHDVQAAGQQNLVDQCVEFGDALLDISLALRVRALLHQFHGHADARERRAQLVRGMGQERFVGADQLLDAAGGAVEALGEPRHLIVAFDLHSSREVSGAERL